MIDSWVTVHSLPDIICLSVHDTRYTLKSCNYEAVT